MKDELEEDLVRQLDKAMKKPVNDIETLEIRTGELGHALREKINQVELFVRDEFVRKETFNLVTDRISLEVKGLGDRLESRQLRMETKFDSIISQRLLDK